MIRHVVVFTWDDGMTQAMEQRFAAELTDFAGLMSGLRSYHAGPDLGLSQGNYDFAVVADFDDEASFVSYRDHPKHKDIISRFSGPHATSRAGVQYEI